MSLSAVQVNKRVVYDPNVDIPNATSYNIPRGGQVSTWQPQVTTNFSTSSINWNVGIPDKSTIIDRHVLMQIPVTITFSGSTTGTQLLPFETGKQAPRAWPINSCISTMSVQLNNQSITSSPQEYVSAIIHHRAYQDKSNIYWSETAALPDNCNDYTALDGTMMTPLAGLKGSTYWQQGRGAFPVKVNSNGASSTVIEATFTEPIIVSPFLWAESQQDYGFRGLSTFNIGVTLNNLQRLWSINTDDIGSTISSVSVSIGNSTLANPQLLMRFITPNLIQDIPKSIPYAQEDVTAYPTNGAANIAASSFTMTSNQLILSQIPSKIFIYCRQSDTTLTASDSYKYADGFAEMKSISINFANIAGILSTATEVDLWRISVKNGMKVSWNDWTGSTTVQNGTNNVRYSGLGSVLCIIPAFDFGLTPDQSPGVVGAQYNFQVTCTFKNISYITQNSTMFVVPVYDNVLTLNDDGTALLEKGVLTPADVVNVDSYPRISYQDVMEGGDFLGSLKQFGSKLLDTLGEVAPYVAKGVDIASRVAPLFGAGGAIARQKDLRQRLPLSRTRVM